MHFHGDPLEFVKKAPLNNEGKNVRQSELAK